ncbi:MAG TPA: hypothetical protein VFG94_03325 [Acidimicrobiales bacterium]|nr:hypothetical protein [Acidimicrobiales bacterium]
MGIRRILVCASALAAAVTACGGDDEPSEVVLAGGDACGDALFWATTAADDVAVTVFVDAVERSSLEPTILEYVLPDPAVQIEIVEGEALSRNFCTDVIDAASEERSRQGVTEGEVTVTLDPASGAQDPFSCGSVSGKLELHGLVAEDGTTFAPVTVTSDAIGCYAG